MTKPITLNETQMELLEEFVKADADVIDLARQVSECKGVTESYRVLNMHFQNMWAKRSQMARKLASSLAITFVAEQGPRKNPEGTAGNTETSAS